MPSRRQNIEANLHEAMELLRAARKSGDLEVEQQLNYYIDCQLVLWEAMKPRARPRKTTKD